MKIRYCPKCGRAGLKWDDVNGKGYDGLTDHERYIAGTYSHTDKRWCPRCQEWVNPDLSHNFDQHKR